VAVGAGLWAAQKYGLTAGELLSSYAYLGALARVLRRVRERLNVARDDDAPALWSALERTVLAFAAFGVCRWRVRDVRAAVYPQGPDNMLWDVQGRRLVSTLLDPNFAGDPPRVPAARARGAAVVRRRGARRGSRCCCSRPPDDGVARGGPRARRGVLAIVAVRGVRRGSPARPG
jgi:hypothetical protein